MGGARSRISSLGQPYARTPVCMYGVCVLAAGLFPTPCQLTPQEAYQHLQRILEQVNVIASEHVASSLFAASDVRPVACSVCVGVSCGRVGERI